MCQSSPNFSGTRWNSELQISQSQSQMHTQQQHSHLQRTFDFEPTSCTSRQCISLDRFVVHLRLARWNQEGRENTAWLGCTNSRFFRADLSSGGFAQVMIGRGPPFGHRNVMEPLSDCIGQGSITRCTDLKNTQTISEPLPCIKAEKAFLKTRFTVAQKWIDRLALSLTQE